MLIISMVHDITARKHAEEERKQSEERYRSLFENAVFGIFRSTPAEYFIDANPALCSMLERLKSRCPNIAVLYMSGFGEDGLRPDEASELSDRFIQKPFRKDTLLSKARADFNATNEQRRPFPILEIAARTGWPVSRWRTSQECVATLRMSA
jgi:PAS domain-containing protein